LLTEAGEINLEIYSTEGKLVKQLKHEIMPQGNHELRWSASENRLNPGMYIVSISGKNRKGNFKETQKVQLLK
jgi:flagellar hook assembly protein FlgD